MDTFKKLKRRLTLSDKDRTIESLPQHSPIEEQRLIHCLSKL